MKDSWGVHNATVEPRFSPLFGIACQPVCSRGCRGGHYASKHRAQAAAQEHEDRSRGLAVTVR